MSNDTKVRRSQLISPFGVGAMMVNRDGVSVICGGLDDWFPIDAGVDVSEFVVHDWRLERYLGVEEFRMPPDSRESFGTLKKPNSGVTIPAKRFPYWHWCERCKGLRQVGQLQKEEVYCDRCNSGHKKKGQRMVQVRFVAMCEQGHIQDFPWREWVHNDPEATCSGQLSLRNLSGLGLGSLLVSCSCGKKRNLTGATSPIETIQCRGHRPWIDNETREACGLPLRGALRSATNVYYADVRSSLHIPVGEVPPRLMELLQNPPISSIIRYLEGTDEQVTAVTLRKNRNHKILLQEYEDEMIDAGLRLLAEGRKETQESEIPREEMEADLRRDEFGVLQSIQDSGELAVAPGLPGDYDGNIFPVAQYFEGLSLINRLRETRVLVGFTRVNPENDLDLASRKRLLWREMPDSEQSWLPATVNYGEGIFLRLNRERLTAWESLEEVRDSVHKMDLRFRKVQEDRKLRERTITPRLVLVHTLAHLLINQLVYECGYSSASLRERLYVADELGDGQPGMAGLLIYTASGDSEGSLGGLVRMGQPGNLEGVLRKAIEGARWCSADPICLEMGRRGQGPDSCNGAACHNCALTPETSCEHFNRFLDRTVLIGDVEKGVPGFFSDLFSGQL